MVVISELVVSSDLNGCHRPPGNLVTIGPNFSSHNRWTNCHRRLVQLSQVTISPPYPRMDEKFMD
jgi:hypothetical protein